MFILGISCFYHDSSATLLKDGEIVNAVQEERFTRKKHDDKFPHSSIKFILKNNAINLSDIDFIVFYEKPFLKFERLLETYINLSPRGLQSFCKSMPIWIKEKIFQKKIIFDELKKIDTNFNEIEKIKFSEHHLSHAASAFYPSPFKEAIILTIDGVGEWATSTIGIGKDNNIKIVKEIHFPHSIGLLYSAFTYFLGFKVNSGEYKVMGLAPYGEPKYTKIIYDNLIDVKPDGSFRLNMKFFNYASGLEMTSNNFSKLFNKKRRKPETENLDKFHMDMAASIQKVTEDIIIKIIRNIYSEFKIDNICLAGGVALNCVANGKIIKEKIFKNIWIQPASGDAGGSLGAALLLWYKKFKKDRYPSNDTMKCSYLGPHFSNEQVEKYLKDLNAKYTFVEDNQMYEIISKNLSSGKAIGWFQGKMEFGPRALGSRSIIADARINDMQKKLNLKVKYRESFRPFAPMVLREDLEKYFDLNIDSPYMLLVANVNKNRILNKNKGYKIEQINEIRSDIPAVTHIDYSARIQTLDEKNNKIYKMLQHHKKKTGCSVLINTSFNVRGEPIVCSPTDAFKCFMSTELDILVIENYILFKEDQDISLKKNYVNSYQLD